MRANKTLKKAECIFFQNLHVCFLKGYIFFIKILRVYSSKVVLFTEANDYIYFLEKNIKEVMRSFIVAKF